MFTKKKTNPEEKEAAQQAAQNPAQEAPTAEPTLRDEALTPDDHQESDPSDSSNTSNTSNTSDPSPSRSPREEIERAYCLGAGIDEDTFAKVKELLEKIAESVYGDRFNPESIQMAVKAMNYDADLAKAREEGLSLGRNEVIAEKFRNRRNAADKAADIPHFKGAKGLGTRLSGNSIFEVARGAKD